MLQVGATGIQEEEEDVKHIQLGAVHSGSVF
jgi:hypothetical protein